MLKRLKIIIIIFIVIGDGGWKVVEVSPQPPKSYFCAILVHTSGGGGIGNIDDNDYGDDSDTNDAERLMLVV